MTIRTLHWTAGPDCGRDKGKRFLITEMPSDQGERWACRLLLALANGGAKLPPGVLDMGIAGVASLAAAAVLALRHLQGLQWAEVEPLLDEMMDCVQLHPLGMTPGGAEIPPQNLMTGRNCQIEEIATRLKLKWEVLGLHVDFLKGDWQSNSAQSPAPEATSP